MIWLKTVLQLILGAAPSIIEAIAKARQRNRERQAKLREKKKKQQAELAKARADYIKDTAAKIEKSK